MNDSTPIFLILELGIGLILFIEIIIIGTCSVTLKENSKVMSAQLDLLLRAQGVPHADRQKVYQSANEPACASPDLAVKINEGEK